MRPFPETASGLRNYDIAPDGQRFLMVKAAGDDDAGTLPPSLILVQYFDEELKRLFSTSSTFPLLLTFP